MSSFASKDVSHISKFNGSNFPFWKFQICLMLEQHELLDIVLGKENLPQPITVQDAGGNSTISNAVEIKNWKMKDNSARCYIVATIEEQTQRTLINCKSSQEMWARLTAQHEQSASENKYFLQQRFFEYSYQQGHDVLSHITAVEAMSNQLNDLGAPVSELQIITKILCTLPPSFRSVVSAWDNLDESKKKLSLLTSRLLKEESLNKVYDSNENPADTAFFAKRLPSSAPNPSSNPATSSGKGNGEGFSSRYKGKNPRFCNFCKRPGHVEETCWKKSGTGPPGPPTANTQHANMAYNKQEPEWPGDYAFTSHSLLSAVDGHKSTDWYADSGASRHMSDQRWSFSKFQEITPGCWPVKGVGIDAKPLYATGRGDIPIRTKVGGVWYDGIIQEVLYVPRLGANLFSVSSAAARGAVFTFSEDEVTITRNSKVIATGISLLNNLYVLNIEATGGQQSSLSTSKSQAITLLSKVTSQPIHVWHQRLGHIHFDRIKQMESSGAVDGLSISTSDKSKFCEGCVFGKHHRQPFPTDGRNRAKRIGEIIHSDLVGPMSVSSPGGARYFALFKDDFSGFCSVSFLKHKSEAANSFQAFVHRVEVETGNKINTLRTDNGGEYVGSSFEEWLKTKGIRHETTVPKTPQQNGVSERQNRTVIESARSMLHFANQPTELWAEATNCAVYVLNRVVAKGLDGKTPYEIWKGRKPNLSHLRIFGCTAYAHIPHDERAKFDPKAIKCCFVGYCETQKAFRLWDPIKRKLRISRDVVFHEEFVTKSLFDIFPDYDPPQSPVEKPDPSEDRDISRSSDEESHNNVPDNFESIQPSIPTSSIKHISSREASTRKKKPPVRWADESTTATYAGMASAYVCDEPETYEEALASDESSSWMEAMKEEIDSLAKNNTWTLVPLPQGRVAIKNRWVF